MLLVTRLEKELCRMNSLGAAAELARGCLEAGQTETCSNCLGFIPRKSWAVESTAVTGLQPYSYREWGKEFQKRPKQERREGKLIGANQAPNVPLISNTGGRLH